MHKSIKILVASFFILLVLTIFIFFRLAVTAKRTKALKSQNAVLFAEKIKLEKQFEEKRRVQDSSISMLKNELSGLKDAKMLKDSLDNVREKLLSLNQKLGEVERQKDILQQKNVSLNSRIDSISKEFAKTLDESKMLKNELSQVKDGKMVRLYKSKFEKTSKLLEENKEQIVKLNQQIKAAEKNNIQINKDNKILEGKINILEKQNKKLEFVLEETRKGYDKKNRPLVELKKKVKDLELRLLDNEKQRQLLEQDLERTAKTRDSLKGQLSQVQELLTVLQKQAKKELGLARNKLEMYAELKKEKSDLQFEREQIEGKMNLQKEEIEDLQAQLNLVRKQLTQSQREKVALAEEIVRLREVKQQLTGEIDTQMVSIDKGQNRVILKDPGLTELEFSSQQNNTMPMQDKLNKAYALYDTAKAQVVKVSELLMRKEIEIDRSKEKISRLEKENEKIASLQAKVDLLNKEILDKEQKIEEQSKGLAELSMLKSNLEGKLTSQVKVHDDVNTLYANLKSQIVHVTNLLSQRELELEAKDTEVLNLKSQIVRFQADVRVMKKALDEAQVRQRRTLEDLRRATRLNSTLQEKLINFYKTETYAVEDKQEVQEKQKAEQLKNRLEGLLD